MSLPPADLFVCFQGAVFSFFRGKEYRDDTMFYFVILLVDSFRADEVEMSFVLVNDGGTSIAYDTDRISLRKYLPERAVQVLY